MISALVGKITIRLEREPKQIVLIVADEKVEMSTNKLGNIFSEFVVSSSTHTPASSISLAPCANEL